jgi:hypothetical protein
LARLEQIKAGRNDFKDGFNAVAVQAPDAKLGFSPDCRTWPAGTDDLGPMWRNAMKAKLIRVLGCFEQAGLIVLEKDSYDRLLETIERQAQEIDALDLRVKRLLER